MADTGGLQQERKKRLEANQALSRVAALREPDDVVGKPMYAQSQEYHQSLSKQNRLNADRARAATEQQTLSPDPAVARLMQNGNINPEQYDAATAQMNAIAEQIKGATTLAEAQAIFSRYETINRNLVESGLTDEQRKKIDQMRDVFWQSVVTTAPLLDDFLGGSDFGVGTFVADFVSLIQWAKGLKYAASQEPASMFAFLTPTPLRFSKKDGDSGIGEILWRRGKQLWQALLWGVQNGWVIMIGGALIFLICTIGYCVPLGVLAYTDPVCRPFIELLSGFGL